MTEKEQPVEASLNFKLYFEEWKQNGSKCYWTEKQIEPFIIFIPPYTVVVKLKYQAHYTPNEPQWYISSPCTARFWLCHVVYNWTCTYLRSKLHTEGIEVFAQHVVNKLYKAHNMWMYLTYSTWWRVHANKQLMKNLKINIQNINFVKTIKINLQKMCTP